MAAPVVESVTNTTFGSDVTTHTANYPATTTSGRLLLILAAFDGNATISTPTDYSIVSISNSGGDPVLGVFGKIASGSEGGTTIDVVTNTSQRGGVQILEISGWKGALADIISSNSVGELGYGNHPLPSGIVWRKLDYRYIHVYCRSSASSFNNVTSGYTGTTQAGEDSSASAAVRCEHIAITDVITIGQHAVPVGHGSSTTGMPQVALLIPPVFTGTVSGNVTLSGSPVSGVEVVARNQTTGDEFTDTTDGSGDYSIPVPNTTDLYHVTVEYNDGSDDYNALSLWDVDAV